jgi:hypothetical protein
MSAPARRDGFRIRVYYEGLDPARLNRRVQTRRAAGGPIREGIDAVIQIAWRVPVLWPAAPLLVVSRWLGFGQRAYDYLAARRHGLRRPTV